MLINGIECNSITTTDRGLAYGDGLFSTIKLEFGKVIDWSFHLQRLQHGTARLFFPSFDWIVLQKEVFNAAEAVKHEAHYVLKVILTRGSGGRGYSAEGCNQVTRIIQLSPFPAQYLQWQLDGIMVVQCDMQLSRNKQLAGLKSLARLEQVLIKQELSLKDAVEGIVCDEFDHVIEACTANIFIFIDGQWLTPKLDYSGVAGVMRRRIMEHDAIDVVEKEITLDELKRAQCLCLTNALMGVVPVMQYEDKVYSAIQRQPITDIQRMLKQGCEVND